MICNCCPRGCNKNRTNGELGYCKMPSDMAVAKIMMHKWEEPFVSGIEYGAKGTGAIFFYGCNLSCIYCQNYKISNEYKNIKMDAYNASTTIENKCNLKNILNNTVVDAHYNSTANENIYNQKNALNNIVGDAHYNSTANENKCNLKNILNNIVGDAHNKSTTNENIYNQKNALNNIVGDALYASRTNISKYIKYTPYELSEEMLKLQNEGAYTISLITANIYIDKVIETIKLAKEKGVTIPFVYNTSGYDSIESLKKLNGLIDIYMPDFKYYDDDLAYKYSDVNDYVEITKSAISEMYNQVKCMEPSSKKHLLVRHLVLPGYIDNSKKILKYLYDTYGDNIYISIMNQYTPTRKLPPPLDRHLTKEEYDEVVDYAINLGITNAYTQDDGTDNESFIPEFY